ncbi:MAG: phosphoribosylglycinamide formyltransferase [Saprospiraceae bacterium]|nr:phosphoribosylglycinamide formyltransferase [Saprospiraceae bacterium]
MSLKKYQLAIFASGGGSNAAKIIEYFKSHATIEVKLVVSNRPDAGVLNIALNAGIPSLVVSPHELGTPGFLQQLSQYRVNTLILAGYLKKIPVELIHAFPEHILNIHPALLPLFGGKGMYGIHVHEAVLEAGVTQSGLTIHLVNAQYDKGRQLFQAICPVFKDDAPSGLAARVLELEHKYYAAIIEKYLLSI